MLGKLFKHFDIMKNIDGEDQLYLKRYLLLRTPFIKIFLHNIRLPDTDPDPHDHPWSFLGLVLKGGYEESRFDRTGKFLSAGERNAPTIGLRKAGSVHQITSVKPGTWTLIITGPIVKEWGFITGGKWMHWRKYLDEWNEIEMD